MDFQNKKAIYLQIADYICEQIILKKWQAKEKIPSVRELAISLAVNPNTVTRTYSVLEEKKIIEMQRGIGYFVTESAYKNVIELKKEVFLTKDLPEIFKSMDLLKISLEQFEKFYRERINHENE